jgi:transposase InsO family protein
MITGLLNNGGWHVNHKRVERACRREGLKVPQKQPKKGRLWLNPSRQCTHRLPVNGVIRVKRRLNSTDVVDALTDLFILRGPPEYIRSNNGAEFIAQKVRAFIGAVGVKTAFIAPSSPEENGYCESFNARLRPSRQIAPQSPAE